MYIIWTSTIECPKGIWSPNHFAPLLALTDVPRIPCKEDISVPQQTEETNFSISSQSYNQNFPDQSSSLEFSNSPKRRKLSRPASKHIRQKQSVNNNLCEDEAKTICNDFNSTKINPADYDKNEPPSINVTPLERNISWSLNQNISTPDEHACNKEECTDRLKSTDT